MAVTVTYLSVGAATLGNTTPPTPTQAQNANSVVATVRPSANADAAATITHNFGMSSSDLTQGWPLINIEVLDGLAQTSNWSIASSDPNFIGLAKNNVAGGGDTVPQIQVTISRPNTLFR